jgi:3-methyl-2-oxobutanoate hydroxymethyltransferase
MTIEKVKNWDRKVPLWALTAYDYSMARILDEAGVPILHVGDSLGMVHLGYSDTTHVTMSDMIRATESVARARKHALITADLPYRSYENVEQAVRNAQLLIQAGADAVKMEGGQDILPQIQAVLGEGIAVQGHLGMLPQRVLEEGGYKKKGKTDSEAQRLLEDSLALEKAGVFSIVFEVVVAEVAEQITKQLSIPTIGIGSGNGTTGQIQVIHDVLGLYPWFSPAHARKVASLSEAISQSIAQLIRTP